MCAEKKHFDIDVVTKLLPLGLQKVLEKIVDVLVLILVLTIFFVSAKFWGVSAVRSSPILGIRESWMYLAATVGSILMVPYIVINLFFENKPK